MDRQPGCFPAQPMSSLLPSNSPVLPVSEPTGQETPVTPPPPAPSGSQHRAVTVDADSGEYLLAPECLHDPGHWSGADGAGASVRPCLNAFAAFFDDYGRCWNEYELHKEVYLHGIEKTARQAVWPCLLGVYAADLSSAQRVEHAAELRTRYQRLHQDASSAQASQRPEDGRLAARIREIEKDVHRTDRDLAFYGDENGAGLAVLGRILASYAAYNPQLGYVQGMNDVASVILLVMKDEVLSFWCFVKAMERMGSVFTDLAAGALGELASLIEHVDFELYRHLNMLSCGTWNFCLRWVLLGFKRELSMNNIIEVWERVWSRHKSVNLIVYMVAGELLLDRLMLLSQRSEEGLHQFTVRVGRNLHVRQLVEEGQALVDKCKPLSHRTSGSSEEHPAPGATLAPPRNGFIPRDADTTPLLRRARVKSALNLSHPSTTGVQLTSPAGSWGSPGISPLSPLAPSTNPPGYGGSGMYGTGRPAAHVMPHAEVEVDLRGFSSGGAAYAGGLPPPAYPSGAHNNVTQPYSMYQAKSPSSYMQFSISPAPAAEERRLNQLAADSPDVTTGGGGVREPEGRVSAATGFRPYWEELAQQPPQGYSQATLSSAPTPQPGFVMAAMDAPDRAVPQAKESHAPEPAPSTGPVNTLFTSVQHITGTNTFIHQAMRPSQQSRQGAPGDINLV